MKMSQTEKLINLLIDGQEHSTVEIMDKVYGGDHLGLARVGARIFDAKQKGYSIVGRRDKNKSSVYWYKMILEPKQLGIADALGLEIKPNNKLNFQ